MDGAEPGGVVEDGDFVVSCDRATVRVNARLGLVDEDDPAGESGGWPPGGGGGREGGCRVEAGEVLDDATAEDGVLQGAPVEAGRQVE